MADKKHSKGADKAKPVEPKKPTQEEIDFDIEADLRKLKRSSNLLAILFVALILAFIGLMGLIFTDFFVLQSTVPEPKMVEVSYPTVNNLPIYMDPSQLSEKVGYLKTYDRVFEFTKIPGFLKVRKGSVTGYVESVKMQTRMQALTIKKNLAELNPLRLFVETKQDIKNYDLIVSGKVFNNIDIPVKDVEINIFFLNDNNDILYKYTTKIATDTQIKKGANEEFETVGRGLLGKATHLCAEIENFTLTQQPPPLPATDDDCAADKKEASPEKAAEGSTVKKEEPEKKPAEPAKKTEEPKKP